MDQRLSLVTLGVAEIARARAFYQRLGWRASASSNASIAFFQLNGFALALYSRAALAEDAALADAGTGFGGISLAYNVRERHEVDALLAAAEAAGGRILKPARDAAWGGYSGYFADPDGHPWEVAWNPGFAILPDGTLRLPD
jgi:catechol 2,3-dioxygenase-like lactoylglutathione lyase family enzyme